MKEVVQQFAHRALERFRNSVGAVRQDGASDFHL